MKKYLIYFFLTGLLISTDALFAQTEKNISQIRLSKDSIPSRLILGGYGEAVMTRNFYSDEWQRYTHASEYKDKEGHGRFDIPHVVLYISYDFGKGWTMGSEIEFEHGGTESAVEMEAEETGEYENEIEKGGEVAIEQFWLQKSFSKAFNLRMGHIVVPIGLTNTHHMPTEFFTVYRPEGENTILPCTWHETGLSLWGNFKNWRYELQFLPGLDSDRFGSQGFVHDGAGSPYEFKIANAYAGVIRIDNYSIKGLRWGMSAYYGNSFSNSLTKNTKYKNCHGGVSIGSFDFHYQAHNWIVRGNLDWAHLDNSKEITAFNKNNMSATSPSPKTTVASDAIATGIEVGYDILSQMNDMKGNDKLYVFGRYEYYDSMMKVADGLLDYTWCGKHRVALGLNYCPMKEIVIKVEYSKRFFKKEYNDEPSVSLGIAYSGFFTK